jgi:hypothetical protein
MRRKKKRSHGWIWLVLVLIGALLLIRAYHMIPAEFLLVLNQPSPTNTRTPAPTRKPTRTPANYHPISWLDLNYFLASDRTNMYDYTSSYRCLNFSFDLVVLARKQNINAWIVAVDFYNEDTGHAFVAFETTDKGIVYIEPQSDYRLTAPKIGEWLCDYWLERGCYGVVSKIYNPVECRSPKIQDCSFTSGSK